MKGFYIESWTLKGYSIIAEYFQILALLISPKNVFPSLELRKIIHPPNYKKLQYYLQNKGENKYYTNTFLWEFGIARAIKNDGAVITLIVFHFLKTLAGCSVDMVM